MRYEDTEFDPATDADREAAAREAELARKIRREVLRVQRGEADDDLRADREAEQEQKDADGPREHLIAPPAWSAAASRVSCGCSFRATSSCAKAFRVTTAT